MTAGMTRGRLARRGPRCRRGRQRAARPGATTTASRPACLPRRSVIGYHSQIVSNPERALEIFVGGCLMVTHIISRGTGEGNYVWLIFVLVVV
jgi:hypothetical protein